MLPSVLCRENTFGIPVYSREYTFPVLFNVFMYAETHKMFLYEVNYFQLQVFSKKNGRSGGWISSDDVPISTVDYSVSKKLTYTFFG
jgi:hypothetical protein